MNKQIQRKDSQNPSASPEAPLSRTLGGFKEGMLMQCGAWVFLTREPGSQPSF